MKNFTYYKHKGRPPNGAKSTEPEVQKPNLTAENRQFRRLQCQLKISIKEIKSVKEIEAESINVSQFGIRIQTAKKFHIGKKLELWVHLQDGLDPVHRFGRVIWLNQIAPFIYNCGIKFESALDLSFL